MRPLELALEGFRSYRSPVTFDFQDRGLFGIVGPTGAGKSSILDGLVFSLYGRTPQIGKDTKKLITSGSAMARVRLVFSADGTSWEVTRVLRDQGASAVVLHRLGEGTPTASGERAVNDRIAEIVGLDYDSFCSSVTLPQGEFDRFLKATPTERSRILKRIFRYERVDAMRELAKQRSAAAEVEVKAALAELSALPADPEALLADLETQQATAAHRVAALREGAGEFAAAEAVLSAAEARVTEIERRRSQLTAALGQIPSGAALESLAAEEDSGLSRLEAARAGWDLARAAARAAADLAAQQQAELGPLLVRARDLLSRRQRVASGAAGRAATVAQLAAAAGKAAQELASIQAAAAAAAGRAGAAQEAVQAAERTHAAHLLRAGLEPGAPCPVCEQRVGVPPPVGATPAALDAARRSAAAATGELARVQGREAAQLGAVASITARLSAAEEEVGRAAAEQAELEAALSQLLGPTPAPEEVARRERLIATASAEAAAARKAADDAGEAAAAVERSLESVARRRRQVAGELVKVCTVVGTEAPGIEDDAATLAGAAKRARDAGQELIAAAAAQVVQVQEEEG
ncbi:MAG TPA: SMC family ATPase, partial [Actinomycetota bacterium]|nr:SMC family ATPase [Actinomycetota bacterium]